MYVRYNHVPADIHIFSSSTPWKIFDLTLEFHARCNLFIHPLSAVSMKCHYSPIPIQVPLIQQAKPSDSEAHHRSTLAL